MENRTKCKYDLYFGVGIAVLGTLYTISTKYTISIREYNIGVTGQTYPIFVGILLTFLGIMLTIQSIQRLGRSTKKEMISIDWKDIKQIVVFLLFLCFYVVGLEYVGYIISSAAMVLATMYLFGARNKLAMAIITIVTPVILYYIFCILLEVQMPQDVLLI